MSPSPWGWATVCALVRLLKGSMQGSDAWPRCRAPVHGPGARVGAMSVDTARSANRGMPGALCGLPTVALL
jgi:hypothetical protein